MKQIKKLLAVLLAMLMLISLLAGCGEKGEVTDDPASTGKTQTDPNLGIYKLSSMAGMSIAEYAELLEMDYQAARDSLTVTLKEGGKATMTSDGEPIEGTWTLEGEKFTLGEDGGSYEGTLKDGVMTIDIEGETVVFTTDEAEGSMTAVETPTEPETEFVSPYEWWNRDWYGWCIFKDATGTFADLDDMGNDAYAEIRVNEDDTGTVTLWHSYGSRDCRMAEAEVYFVEGDGENGRMLSSGGSFFPDGLFQLGGDAAEPMELVYYDWVVEPEDEPYNQFNDMIQIKGYYTDPVDEENTFTYYIFLKPWGETWDDVRDGDTEDCLYDDMMPFYYEDWYLPLLELGYDSIVEYDEGIELIENGTYAPGYEPGSTPEISTPGGTGDHSALLGSSPEKLDVNDRGIVNVYYPADQFTYDDDYGKLKNADTGVGILIDPMLGENNFDELRESYEKNNSDEDDYSLTETTVNGYRAQIMTYTDWLGATMRVDIDFGGAHGSWYGISFAVSGDSLADCDSDIVWAIIESMEVLK